jgi:hypothetical protein
VTYNKIIIKPSLATEELFTMRQGWESNKVTKLRLGRDLIVRRAFIITKHSDVKEEADKGMLLENFIEILKMKKE